MWVSKLKVFVRVTYVVVRHRSGIGLLFVIGSPQVLSSHTHTPSHTPPPPHTHTHTLTHSHTHTHTQENEDLLSTSSYEGFVARDHYALCLTPRPITSLGPGRRGGECVECVSVEV